MIPRPKHDVTADEAHKIRLCIENYGFGPEYAALVATDHPRMMDLFRFAEWVQHCKEYDTLIPSLESPIEKLFFEACKTEGIFMEPQYRVGKYRIDFALPIQRIAVEIDGHDYHKTKEQRTRDAARDRWLTIEGWTVIRFTGSEVYANPEACTSQIRELVCKLIGDNS